MKKILAALVLLALVFGGVFAQEMKVTATLEVDADLFSVSGSKVSDKEAAWGDQIKDRTSGGTNRTDPDASWAILDRNSFDWSSTFIQFAVTADNYGGTLQIGASPTAAGNQAADPVRLRKLEIWLQPASFLKLWAANSDGRSAWRAIDRVLPVGMDGLSLTPPADYYGTNGFNGGFNRIDTFTNGLKADLLLDAVVEGLKVELLAGYNNPLWLKTGKVTIVDATGTSLAAEGHSDIEAFGRDAPNYGVRVTFPFADIGKFYGIYRLGVHGWTDKATDGKRVEQNGVAVSADEYKGFDVGRNNFGIFADLSPLFGSMDLPLNLVLGYTGYFEAGAKITGKEDIKQTVLGTDYYYNEWVDAKTPYVSGIDLRLGYKLSDQFAIALHNNATFFSVFYDDSRWGGAGFTHSKYDHIGFDKYTTLSTNTAFTSPANIQGAGYASLLQDNYTYFRLYNELGAQYQIVDDFFAVNLQLSNDLETFGSTAYMDFQKEYDSYRYLTDPNAIGNAQADYKWEKGDALYTDTFSALLTGILTISPKAELDIGLKLTVATDATTTSNKSLVAPIFANADEQRAFQTSQSKEASKVYTTTTTGFSIPVSFIVKF